MRPRVGDYVYRGRAFFRIDSPLRQPEWDELSKIGFAIARRGASYPHGGRHTRTLILNREGQTIGSELIEEVGR